MTKEELQAKLDAAGKEYDKRWGVARLEAAVADIPTYSEAQIQAAVDDVTGKNELPIEKILENTTREFGEVRTASGIVVPGEVLASYSKTTWNYSLDKKTDSVAVYRSTSNGYNEFVREYTRSTHGESFLRLAEDFVRKNS